MRLVSGLLLVYLLMFQLNAVINKHIYGITEAKEAPLANSHIRGMLERTLDFLPVLIFCLFYPASFK